MIKYRFLLLLFLITWQSCRQEWDPYQDKNYTIIDMESFPIQELTEYQKIDYDTTKILHLSRLLIIDDYVLIADLQGDHLLHILRLPDFQYIRSCLIKGQGPGEFLNVWEISKMDDNRISVFDVIQLKLAFFEVDRLIYGSSKQPTYEIKSDKGFFTSIMYYENELFFLDNEIGKNRVYQSDSAFNDMKGYGTLLTKKDKETTDLVHVGLCEARAARLGKKIFIGYKKFPFIEVFDLEDKSWQGYVMPEIFNPEYAVIKRTDGLPGFTNILSKTRDAYFQVYTTEKYAYLLYDGKVWEEGNETEGNSIIFVFDTLGKPVTQLKLSRGIIGMAVYEDRILYGEIIGKNNIEIIRYEFSLDN